MKFCSLVLKLHLPLNFCHRHTDRRTDIFQKQSNRVQDIPKRVNPSKTGNRKFARNQYFLLLTQKKVIIHSYLIKFQEYSFACHLNLCLWNACTFTFRHSATLQIYVRCLDHYEQLKTFHFKNLIKNSKIGLLDIP